MAPNSISHTYSVEEVTADLWHGHRLMMQQYLARHSLTALPEFQLNTEGTAILAWFPISWTTPEEMEIKGVTIPAGAVVKMWEAREVPINEQNLSIAIEKNAMFFDPDAPYTPDDPETETVDERAEQILAATQRLDRTNTELFTANGSPSLDALKAEAAMTDISAAERDVAWIAAQNA